MNSDSLKEKFKQIQDDENKIFQQADEIIDKTHNLSTEASRVADVAKHSKEIMREIEQDFASSTSITNTTDMAFMGVAIALQCLRWYILNKLTERKQEGTSSFEQWVKKHYDGTDAQMPIPYYASYSYIKGNPTVPYDAVAGTKIYNVGGNGGLNGKHRFKTLGHDPKLGLVFGTANILTSTLTNNHFQTFHVMQKGNTVIGNASTITMFTKMAERISREPKSLGAAVIKQGLHIATDMYTKEGIPLPFIQTLSPELAEILGKYGLDTGGLIKATGSAKLAALIDSLIATIHGLYWNENECTLDEFKVRTKTILSVSKTIAECSNIIYTIFTNNIYNLDIGGLWYTFSDLLKNIDFITEVKKEYMSSSFNKKIVGTT